MTSISGRFPSQRRIWRQRPSKVAASFTLRLVQLITAHHLESLNILDFLPLGSCSSFFIFDIFNVPLILPHHHFYIFLVFIHLFLLYLQSFLYLLVKGLLDFHILYFFLICFVLLSLSSYSIFF
jgi:hypothetical protein